MTVQVDLNADLGEGAPTDEALLDVITSANIACGGHAGDEASMRRTVRLAASRAVGVGAHPSYPDRVGFGRRVVSISPAALVASLIEQIQALSAIAVREGVSLQHVKAHGALYHVAVTDEAIAGAIGQAVRSVDPGLILVALAGSRPEGIWHAMGLHVAREAFIDRGYTAAGTLIPRDQAGALLTDPAGAAARAVRMVRDGVVASVQGRDVPVQADTLCVHADTPGSHHIAAAVRQALESSSIRVVRMAEFLN